MTLEEEIKYYPQGPGLAFMFFFSVPFTRKEDVREREHLWNRKDQLGLNPGAVHY